MEAVKKKNIDSAISQARRKIKEIQLYEEIYKEIAPRFNYMNGDEYLEKFPNPRKAREILIESRANNGIYQHKVWEFKTLKTLIRDTISGIKDEYYEAIEDGEIEPVSSQKQLNEMVLNECIDSVKEEGGRIFRCLGHIMDEELEEFSDMPSGETSLRSLLLMISLGFVFVMVLTFFLLFG